MKWLLVLLVGNAFGQDAPAGDVKRGHAAFLKYQCYTCHGTVGQGAERGAGPKLAPNPFPWAGFEFQVRTPRQDMPAYRQQHMPDQDLADVYAYVRSIKPSPAASAIPLLKGD
jgi:ubiquinol-cytochrome c reductase cytochrome c subunit